MTWMMARHPALHSQRRAGVRGVGKPNQGVSRRREAPCQPTHRATFLAASPCADEEGGGNRGKQSRSEKKSRKAMQKLGMKPVPGVSRVTIKKSKNVSRGPRGVRACAWGASHACTHAFRHA